MAWVSLNRLHMSFIEFFFLFDEGRGKGRGRKGGRGGDFSFFEMIFFLERE